MTVITRPRSVSCLEYQTGAEDEKYCESNVMPLDPSSFPFRTANRQSKQSDFILEYESGIYDYFKVRDLLNDSLIQVALCDGEISAVSFCVVILLLDSFVQQHT